MTRYLCDVCGQDIPVAKLGAASGDEQAARVYPYYLSIKHQSAALYFWEVCHGCAAKVEYFVQQLIQTARAKDREDKDEAIARQLITPPASDAPTDSER